MLSLKKYNIPWPVLFIEVISIIIGVFLALGVNEWRAELKKQEQVETAIVNISKELQNNKKDLESSFGYHEELLKNINEILKDDKKDKDFTFEGIRPAILQRSNYQAALNSNVFSYMNFDIAQKISQVYLLIEKLDEYLNLFTLAGLNNNFFMDADFKEGLIFVKTSLKDIHNIEFIIKNQIDTTLSSLKNYKKL